MRPATMLLNVLALVVFAVLPCAMASPRPSPAVAARNASPVERRAGVPSPYLGRRDPAPAPAPAPAPSGYRKRDAPKQEPIDTETRISQYLCPRLMRACPVTPQPTPAVVVTVEQLIQDGFECVDDREDLTSCGGCGLSDPKYDCTAIDGAMGVSCIVGACQVDSCASGYTLALDRKTCLKV